MKKANCFQLGHIAKLHGYKGEVSLFLDVTNPSDYKELESMFIEIDNQLTPFFVERIQLKNKGFAALKLEGVNAENDARILLRKEVFLPLENLPKLSDTKFYDHEIVGFTVIDEQHGKIGRMQQVIDFNANPLFQIMHGEKELLIPIVENTVQKVDRENKTITISSPPGLVEMYLEE